jgi:putative DNA primase/helicase
MLLAEYLGYCFLKNKELKLEKVLMLYGAGHNGKSVLFDIIKELFGKENFSSFSPQTLMSQSEGAKFRAKIENKLINFASECGNSINADMFKKMASGEPLDARPMYGQPYEIEEYAKLIFNANELPIAPEMTYAYFRRFIIIPFNVQISEAERDVNLAKKIISSELPGVFNWILSGLRSLLNNKSFTKSEECEKFLTNYQKQSDSVLLFIEENSLLPNLEGETYCLKGLYTAYRAFCSDNGYRPISNKKLAERLISAGFEKSRNSEGTCFNISRNRNLFYKEKPVKLTTAEANRIRTGGIVK